MSNEPKTVKEEIAEVLDGFEEEMLASIRRGKEMANKPVAEIVQFPPKLNEQGPFRRQQIIDQDWQRLREWQINEQRREAGLPSLKMSREMLENEEQKGLYAQPQGQGVVSEYNPFRKLT